MKLEVANAHRDRDDVLMTKISKILKVPKNVRNRLDLVCIDTKSLHDKFQTARLNNNGFTGVFVKWEHDEKMRNRI